MEVMQLDRSATQKECYTKKLKHKKSGKSKIWKKSAQEQCAKVHKSIKGRPLKDRHTLVNKPLTNK